MIEVRLNFNTIAEAVAFLAGSGSAAPVSSSITPEKQQAARDSTAAGKVAKAASAPSPAPAAEPAPSPAPAVAPAADVKPDLTKLRTDTSAKIVKLAGMNQDAAVALLAGFNVKRAKELADDQLADALAAVDKALATADMS